MFDRLLQRLRQQSDERRAVRELNALSDRDLNDIGISRYDIERIVRQKKKGY